MENYIPTIFLYWVIYAFIGWIMETIYCSIPEGKFVERGFLNGPIVPIYGFGALFVLSILNPFFNHPILIFILGFLITSLLEYITSYIMEKAFDMRWWDYSTYKFNINGRVCLLNSTMFATLCVILTEWVHPFVARNIAAVPANIQLLSASILLIAICADTVASVSAVLNLKERFKSLETLQKELSEVRESISKTNEQRIEEILKRINALTKTERFNQRRILRSFPSLRSSRWQKHLESIRSENSKKQ